MDHEGVISFSATAGFDVEGLTTSFYQSKAIARYSAESPSLGSDPLVWVNLISKGLPDLEQDEAQFRPITKRDPNNGIPYLEFEAERGTFMVTPTSVALSGELTVVILVKLILDRDDVTGNARKRVGTFLGLGNRDVQFYHDYTDITTDLQLRVPGSSVRYQFSENGGWNAFSFRFGTPYSGIFKNASEMDPFLSREPVLEGSGVFPLSVGMGLGGRGYLDAQIAEIEIYEGQASDFEMRDLLNGLLARTIRPSVSVEGSGGFQTQGFVDRRASVSFEGVGSLQASGVVTPADLEGALAWFNGDDERYAGLEDCSRIPTWYDSTGSGRDIAFNSYIPCQPYYKRDFYNTGGALSLPGEGSGVMACIESGLGPGPYTIFILGRAASGSGFRCYFRIGNALGIGLRQNTDDPTQDDLIVTLNPGHVAERQAVFLAAVPRGEFFELLLRGEPAAPNFTLEVSVNRTVLIPDEEDLAQSPDAIDLANEDSEVFTPEDPFSNPYTKTYEMERDGYVYIGQGGDPAYAQIAWYEVALTPSDLALLYSWIDGHYPP